MFYNDSSMLYWLRVGLAAQAGLAEPTQAALYGALEAYYWNNGLYDQIMQALYDKAIWTEGMKPLRNPANRVVEFYVSKIWPGALPDALPIVTDNQRIVDPIHQVWEWSNWGQAKQRASRWLALFGDLFIKVATKPDKVYFQLIKPQNVTDLDHDEREYLTWLRLDIPIIKRVEGRPTTYTRTEVWDKASQTQQVWEHQQGPAADLSALGAPVVNKLQDSGIDFLPFVHGKFKDTGESRGANAFLHALDKIDEANRQATRLHQMLFRYNRPLMSVSAGGLDPTGRPLPAPRLTNTPGEPQSTGDSTLKDDSLLYLPGMSKLDALVPSLDYSGALDILNAQITEIEKDLPELVYYRLSDFGTNLSGKALGLIMAGAVDKVIEARGGAEQALTRANQMALTIGQQAGLFSNIGNYQAGDYAHSFADRPIMPTTELEESEVIKNQVAAGVPLVTSLRRAGWSEDELAQLEKDQAESDKRRQETFGQAMLTQARNFDQGANPPQSQTQQQGDSE